ncbi:tRNA dimethylallyltransferase [Caulobacter ginsengisoli]|uniref:tRNA dimethylallyltransferase n=2 Tax=Caulobacter ginsengisoli TaxID=400775 RepID=A0ABU0INQ3_9CAUL|nr:tRNA dimethylallyltransferase [Caulobacter ginsengisoli]
MTSRIWLIAGPTASGKSALALRLARETGGEIVNADALQLYADLRVLSARPAPDEEAQAPHHLFGVADGADGWSVGRWLRAATGVLDDIAARGRTAIVVGGTGLYFKALTEGLAEIPPVPVEARAEAAGVFDTLGEAATRARLAAADPVSEARIAPGDRTRLIRALEVWLATGRALTAWHADTRPALTPDSWRAVAIEPDRAALYGRCDARLGAMLEAGALDEVARLAGRGLASDLPVMKAVGVRELAAHLRGELTLEAALTAARQETRRYAKRQLTWIRNQTPDWPRITALEPDAAWRQLGP